MKQKGKLPSSHIIDIAPMGAPRMTRSDKWNKREVVARYFRFKDDVRSLCERVGYEQGERLDIVFVMPAPPSWSKKKAASFLGKPHQNKPDTDNMVKAWLDAHLKEDSHVWDIKAMKIWGEYGQIMLGCYDEVKKGFSEDVI